MMINFLIVILAAMVLCVFFHLTREHIEGRLLGRMLKLEEKLDANFEEVDNLRGELNSLRFKLEYPLGYNVFVSDFYTGSPLILETMYLQNVIHIHLRNAVNACEKIESFQLVGNKLYLETDNYKEEYFIDYKNKQAVKLDETRDIKGEIYV